MLCPKCGFFSAEQLSECLKCGHTLNSKPAQTVVKRSGGTIISPGMVRFIIYAGAVYMLCVFFQKMFTSYLEAESARVESIMLSQALENKKNQKMVDGLE